MWIIDIRHMLDDTQSGPAVPSLKLKVQKLSEIITYATSVEAGIDTDSQPLCWRRPKRRACPGILEISFDPDADEIHWLCPVCGDEGLVSGWRGLIWDMTDYKSDSYH
jgi:RNA polymerase subunit RPABC4/transcription elongation factor Spt4